MNAIDKLISKDFGEMAVTIGRKSSDRIHRCAKALIEKNILVNPDEICGIIAEEVSRALKEKGIEGCACWEGLVLTVCPNRTELTDSITCATKEKDGKPAVLFIDD